MYPLISWSISQSHWSNCRPELKEKFAAEYRANYGKEPRTTEEEREPKKEETNCCSSLAVCALLI